MTYTCRISRFQDGGSFQLNPLVTTCRLRILCRMVTNQIQRYKQIALESLITSHKRPSMNILLLHFYNHYTKNKHLNSFNSSEIKILKMKNKKYHTVRKIPKSNIKIVERGKIAIPNKVLLYFLYHNKGEIIYLFSIVYYINE